MDRSIPSCIPAEALDAALDLLGIDRRWLVKAEIGLDITLTYYRVNDDGTYVYLGNGDNAAETFQVAIERSDV